MKRLVIFTVIIFSALIIKAQDFSYLKDINIEETSQKAVADEAAMDCCTYLTNMRYDDSDQQRTLATQYISEWLAAVYADSFMLNDLFQEATAQEDVYQVYFALNYLEYKDEMNLLELQTEALKGVVSYCANSSNKLKMTKELKKVQKMIKEGTLQENIQSSDFITSIK